MIKYILTFCLLPATVFTEPFIDSCITKALEYYPEIKIAEAQISALKGENLTASAWKNPKIGMEWGKVKSKSLADNSRIKGNTQTYKIDQTIEFPGKRALRQAIANKNVQMAELALKQLKLDIAARIRIDLMDLRAIHIQLKAAKEVEERGEILTKMLINQPTIGMQSLIDRNMIDLALVTFKIKSYKAQQQYESKKVALNFFLKDRLDIENYLEKIEPIKIELDKDTLWQKIKNNSIAIQLQEISSGQALDNFRSAKLDPYPDITISPFYEKSRLREKDRSAGIGFSISLPLWNQDTGKIQTARSELEKTRFVIEQFLRDFEIEFKQLYSAYEIAHHQAKEIPLDSIKNWQNIAEFVDRQYRLGTVNVQSYLETQERYLNSATAITEMMTNVNEQALQLHLMSSDPILLGGQSAKK